MKKEDINREDIKVVTIRKFHSEAEAQIARTLLESNGIECSLIHSTVSSILPFMPGDMTIDLIAREEDQEKIEKLLAAGFDKNEIS